MKANTYRILYALFSVALALQIAVAMLSYRAMNRSAIAVQWVSHTHVVLAELTALQLSVLEAENARRGFILTGDANQLGPYRATIGAIPEADVHDGKVLILDPDPPDKPGSANFRRWSYIKNDAPHLAQKLSPRIFETVVKLVELPSVDVNHLQKAGWFKGPQERAFLAALRHCVNFQSPSKICLSQKVVV
jgi:CHASE3 domain-containing protein